MKKVAHVTRRCPKYPIYGTKRVLKTDRNMILYERSAIRTFVRNRDIYLINVQ